ncbi:MAG: molybdopterin molybdotransferase MoeA [Desulfitobacterium hafniense]|nr:molybdopterin molybdotransferase MoeA [Desulfitobacterium hafniense]
MEKMIELERAQELTLAHVIPTVTEVVPLAKAYQRIIAKPVHSLISMPPFDRSPLDGFAYRANTLDSVPLTLKIISEIPAGSYSDREIGLGECAKIFTGAPVPPGANCVVRFEDTELVEDTVIIKRTVLPGTNVVRKGEEIQAGDEIFPSGTVLTPPAVGLLAAVGVKEVTVYQRPKVGLLSTGSELLDAGEPLGPGKIYNSNTYTLRGLLELAGYEVKVLPLVKDDLADTIKALQTLEDTDLIIATGGASVGDYDFMPEAMKNHGCNLLFWKVNIKPGTPVAVGVKEGKLYFSLSGNPAAAMMTFELLVRPALRKLAGYTSFLPKELPVKVKGEFPKGGTQRRFLRAKAIFKESEVWAEPTAHQSSGILRSMVGSNLLIDIPKSHGPVRQGEIFRGILINWEED